MQEYNKEEKERLKSQYYYSSEFLSYYQKMVVQRVDMEKSLSLFFKRKEVKNILLDDLKLTKQLSLYAYKFIGKDIKKELLIYYEKAYSIQTHPFFITYFKSKKIKEQILSEIEKKDILIVDSRDYPIKDYIIALNQAKLLDANDKIKIINIYSKNHEIIKKNSLFSPQEKELLKEFFIVLETILTQKEKTSTSKTKNIYKKVKKEFLDSIKDFYNFEWLYSGTGQEFKQNFSNALTYFSFLGEAAQYLYVFNAALTKILVQDDSNFEAVIGQFVDNYETYENKLFINPETTKILLQIMTKFKRAIPDCYDDLFIKEEMILLAKKMAAEKAEKKEDKVIKYWQKILIR